jgi:hypothetical protein
MRDEESIAFAEKQRGQFREPAGTALASVIPEDGWKRAFAVWFVKEPMKDEVSARERHLNGILRGLRVCKCREEHEKGKRDGRERRLVSQKTK